MQIQPCQRNPAVLLWVGVMVLLKEKKSNKSAWKKMKRRTKKGLGKITVPLSLYYDKIQNNKEWNENDINATFTLTSYSLNSRANWALQPWMATILKEENIYFKLRRSQPKTTQVSVPCSYCISHILKKRMLWRATYICIMKRPGIKYESLVWFILF